MFKWLLGIGEFCEIIRCSKIKKVVFIEVFFKKVLFLVYFKKLFLIVKIVLYNIYMLFY